MKLMKLCVLLGWLLGLVGCISEPGGRSSSPVSSSSDIETSSQGHSSSSSVENQVPTPQSIAIQEGQVGLCDFTADVAVVESNWGGFLGDGFINTVNEDGVSLSWGLISDSATMLTLRIRYANGAASPRNSTVVINNNGAAQPIQFAQTGAWDNWQDIEIELPFYDGANLITITAANPQGLPNIDEVGVTGLASIEAAQCQGGLVKMPAGNAMGAGDEITSVEAFGRTLLPVLRENCAICHANGLGPQHSVADPSAAHSVAVNFADLSNPSNSRFVTRMRVDEHSCIGGNCESAGDILESAISEWAGLIDGSISADDANACKTVLQQDLILLADLPFTNNLKILFGESALAGGDNILPDAATKLFSQKGLVANTSLINSRLDWAEFVTDKLAENAEQFTGCFDRNRACIQDFVGDLAYRAFRRPVNQQEIDDLMSVFDVGASESFSSGVKTMLQAIILSPSFNHRTEFGTRSAESGEYNLTPYEIANAMSFFLTDSMPDDQLLASAQSGRLLLPQERVAQAERLLGEDATRASIESTLLAAWNMGNIFGKAKDPGLFPEYSPNLAAQMYEETRLFLRNHLWDGDISRVLTSQTTYVNEALADLYGINFPGGDPNQFVQVQVPGNQRAGLLTQASVMTTFSRTDQTSVVARGLFVNGPLLCLPEIPSPPEDIIAAVEAQLDSGATEKELAEFRASTSPCSNCHSQFDAYGLLFERYDALGKYRTQDEAGNSTLDPIDLSLVAAFDGVINSATDFAQIAASGDEFVGCVTRHMFAYSTGDNGFTSHQCDVTNVTHNLSDGGSLTEIIKGVVGSPTLVKRVSEASK